MQLLVFNRLVKYRLLNLTGRIHIVGNYIIKSVDRSEIILCTKCDVRFGSCIGIFGNNLGMTLCEAVNNISNYKYINPYIKLIGMVNSSLFLNSFIRRNLWYGEV